MLVGLALGMGLVFGGLFFSAGQDERLKERVLTKTNFWLVLSGVIHVRFFGLCGSHAAVDGQLDDTSGCAGSGQHTHCRTDQSSAQSNRPQSPPTPITPTPKRSCGSRARSSLTARTASSSPASTTMPAATSATGALWRSVHCFTLFAFLCLSVLIYSVCVCLSLCLYM